MIEFPLNGARLSQVTAVAQTLAFLATAGWLLLCGVMGVVFLMKRRTRLALTSLALAGASGVLYTALLLWAGLSSHTSVLAHGNTKVFCEVDCHIGFNVVRAAHDGTALRVTVRETFLAASVSPKRGNGPLSPGTRRIALVTADDREVAPSTVHTLSPAPLFERLRPGEVHEAELLFDVPWGVALKGLLVESDDPVARFLIASERSPYHGKVLLALPPPARPQSSSSRTFLIRSFGANGLPMNALRASVGTSWPAG